MCAGRKGDRMTERGKRDEAKSKPGGQRQREEGGHLTPSLPITANIGNEERGTDGRGMTLLNYSALAKSCKPDVVRCTLRTTHAHHRLAFNC